MADITVGVRLFDRGGAPVDADESAIAALGARWIQIGDVRLDADAVGILGFEYVAEGMDPHRLTITFSPGRFKTVQYDDPEYAKPGEVVDGG